PLPPSPHLTPPPPHPHPQNGVVVVGFIGKRYTDVSTLINRVVDSAVFGSGNLDKPLLNFSEKVEFSDEMMRWFESRRISYYHDEKKGILYLQFSSTVCPVMEKTEIGSCLDLEDHEFGDLKGMLFMFSVCHVIVFIQEGSHFNTQVLQKFRLLQTAKHVMIPFVRSMINSPGPSSSNLPSVSPSNNPSPGRGRAILNRNASAVALMSGLGSYSSLLPGQCSPVTLFVFLDEFSDVIPTVSSEEPAESSSLNQTSSSNNMTRSNFPIKGSGSVVMLARPVNKSEGSFRKRLQSSLEGQIRFSIKKCRTLSGSEASHPGSRSSGVSISTPLFSLDASKAVALVDRSANQVGKSLGFAIDLVEDILNGKATSDCLLLESHSQSARQEDILSVKEFIFRQSDIFRGKGGSACSSNSGSAAGVGMVAVAAAAAAASASSSGKTTVTPDLPSFGFWLSSSQILFHRILSAKFQWGEEAVTARRLLSQHNFVPPHAADEPKLKDSLEAAVSCLENGRGLVSKFSTFWCEKSLPVAKDVYIAELPPCYSTSQHKAHLEKALSVFSSMVKGPTVHSYIKQLEDECTSLWASGRQLCDAVSLTGRPCIHQTHDESKPHYSGYVFLHACSCGRSRRLRPDPFDFETANVMSSFFPECDKLLPGLQFPQGLTGGPIQPSSWCLIRVGGTRYYEPSKGLQQSGFCSSGRSLLKWTILRDRQKALDDSSCINLQQISPNESSSSTKDLLSVDASVKKGSALPGEVHNGVQIQKKPSTENLKSDNNFIGFGRGVSNFTMKKPFSEVVAGSGPTSSHFPPLKSKKPSLPNMEKVIKKNTNKPGNSDEKINEQLDYRYSDKTGDISAVNGMKTRTDGLSDRKPAVQTGSNIVPTQVCNGVKMKEINLPYSTLYIGYEYECPHGHRFILTPDQLSHLGSFYSMPVELFAPLSMDKEHTMGDPSKLAKGLEKSHKQSNGMLARPGNKRSSEKLRERVLNGRVHAENHARFSDQATKQASTASLDYSQDDLRTTLQSITLDNGGSVLSMLNKNLPVYMNCPYCKDLKYKKNQANVKFAGSISQMQRIFMVTPPLPVILAMCPTVQFDASCFPASVVDSEKLQFNVGCQVMLPPESFLSFRLPFVYGVELDGKFHPLKPLEHHPEMTAWLLKGTTLQIISKEYNADEGLKSKAMN
ncbi:hypothetical protein Leryth_011743, partial [Lithospermum erythrorhizon]